MPLGGAIESIIIARSIAQPLHSDHEIKTVLYCFSPFLCYGRELLARAIIFKTLGKSQMFQKTQFLVLLFPTLNVVLTFISASKKNQKKTHYMASKRNMQNKIDNLHLPQTTKFYPKLVFLLFILSCKMRTKRDSIKV